jgi:hypothetical protein
MVLWLMVERRPPIVSFTKASKRATDTDDPSVELDPRERCGTCYPADAKSDTVKTCG